MRALGPRVRLVLALAVSLSGSPALAAGIALSSPAHRNIRDFFLPESGFTFIQYGAYYTTDELEDAHGDEVTSLDVTTPRGETVPLGFHASVDVFVLAPTFIWVAPWDVDGFRFGVLVTPTFGDASAKSTLTFQGDVVHDTDQSQGSATSSCSRCGWAGRRRTSTPRRRTASWRPPAPTTSRP